jgi:hypothetical protein
VRGGRAVERDARARREWRLHVHAGQAHAASSAPRATPASQSISPGAIT